MYVDVTKLFSSLIPLRLRSRSSRTFLLSARNKAPLPAGGRRVGDRGLCGTAGMPPFSAEGEVMQAGTFSLKGSQLLEPVGGVPSICNKSG